MCRVIRSARDAPVPATHPELLHSAREPLHRLATAEHDAACDGRTFILSKRCRVWRIACRQGLLDRPGRSKELTQHMSQKVPTGSFSPAEANSNGARGDWADISVRSLRGTAALRGCCLLTSAVDRTKSERRAATPRRLLGSEACVRLIDELVCLREGAGTASSLRWVAAPQVLSPGSFACARGDAPAARRHHAVSA